MKLGNLILVPLFALVAISFVAITEARGGGGGGGGGSGGGRGGGGGGRGSGGRGSGGRGASSGKSGGGSKLSTGKKVGLVAAGGVVSYAAYRGYKSSHPKNKDDRDSPDLDYDGSDGRTYNVQGRTGYSREGGGMSALGIILLILAIIGTGTVVWMCYNIGLPCWQDRQSKRNRTLTFPHVITGGKGEDDLPLRETPTTATPSPHSEKESNHFRV